jgi:hypothetical protein
MHRELAPNYSQLLCHVDNAFVFFSLMLRRFVWYLLFVFVVQEASKTPASLKQKMTTEQGLSFAPVHASKQSQKSPTTTAQQTKAFGFFAVG